MAPAISLLALFSVTAPVPALMVVPLTTKAAPVCVTLLPVAVTFRLAALPAPVVPMVSSTVSSVFTSVTAPVPVELKAPTSLLFLSSVTTPAPPLAVVVSATSSTPPDWVIFWPVRVSLPAAVTLAPMSRSPPVVPLKATSVADSATLVDSPLPVSVRSPAPREMAPPTTVSVPPSASRRRSWPATFAVTSAFRLPVPATTVMAPPVTVTVSPKALDWSSVTLPLLASTFVVPETNAAPVWVTFLSVAVNCRLDAALPTPLAPMAPSAVSKVFTKVTAPLPLELMAPVKALAASVALTAPVPALNDVMPVTVAVPPTVMALSVLFSVSLPDATTASVVRPVPPVSDTSAPLMTVPVRSSVPAEASETAPAPWSMVPAAVKVRLPAVASRMRSLSLVPVTPETSRLPEESLMRTEPVEVVDTLPVNWLLTAVFSEMSPEPTVSVVAPPMLTAPVCVTLSLVVLSLKSPPVLTPPRTVATSLEISAVVPVCTTTGPANSLAWSSLMLPSAVVMSDVLPETKATALWVMVPPEVTSKPAAALPAPVVPMAPSLVSLLLTRTTAPLPVELKVPVNSLPVWFSDTVPVPPATVVVPVTFATPCGLRQPGRAGDTQVAGGREVAGQGDRAGIAVGDVSAGNYRGGHRARAAIQGDVARTGGHTPGQTDAARARGETGRTAARGNGARRGGGDRLGGHAARGRLDRQRAAPRGDRAAQGHARPPAGSMVPPFDARLPVAEILTAPAWLPAVATVAPEASVPLPALEPAASTRFRVALSAIQQWPH